MQNTALYAPITFEEIVIVMINTKKFRDGLAEETHDYHAIRDNLRHQLRHPGRALDLKAKDLIGHLRVSLIIDQSECLVCFLFLHWINSFRKKWTTTLSLQNMFQSIIDHRQLKVVDDEFEFHLKLQCELTLLHSR